MTRARPPGPGVGRLPSVEARHVVLALLMASFFVLMAARFVISPLVPAITGDLGVSTGALGLALTGLWAGYAVCQLPGSLLARRVGERAVVLLALAGTVVCDLLLFVAPSYPAFLAGAVLLGATAGVYYPVAVSVLADSYENTGQALGLHVSGGDLAGLVAPVAATAVALRFGWRWAHLLAAGLALPVLLACAAWLAVPAGDGGRAADREPLRPAALLAVLRRPTTAYTLGLAVVLAFAFQSLLSFLPTFLVEHRGFATGRAGLAFGAVFALLVLAIPVVGRLSDAVGRDRVLALLVATLGGGVALAVVAPGEAGVLAGLGLVGVGMSWGGVVGARFMDGLADADRLTGYGAARTVYVLCGATGPVVTGVIADAAGWPAAFGLLVGLLAVALAALLANHALGAGL